MNDRQVPLAPQLRMIIDQLGDPYVWVDVTMPEGAALSADQCEQLGLKIIAAAAAARARAAVARKQMLAGIPSAEAVQFTREMLDE